MRICLACTSPIKTRAPLRHLAQIICGNGQCSGLQGVRSGRLDAAHTFFAAQGLLFAWITRPFMGRTLRTADPHCIPLELYASMDRLAPFHQKYALYHGVKPLRIDHFNCFSPDVDAPVAFNNSFGFRDTEYTEDEGSKKLWAAWMHRKGGVHDVAWQVLPEIHDRAET